eukprot:176309_1
MNVVISVIFSAFWFYIAHIVPLSALTNPHIIYVLMDDFGWANVGFNNPRQQTPTLDNLLKESIHLTQYYVYQYCSPTRSAFLSGRLPFHVNEKNGPPCVPRAGIPENMTTISQKLTGESNYIAHQVGKWHAGFSSMKLTPFGRNFTSSLGYLNGMEDHYTQYFSHKCANMSCEGTDMFDTTKPAYGQNGTVYNGYIYSKRAIDIINNHNENFKQYPLFLYLATQNTHGPYEVPIQYINKFNSSWYQTQRNFSGMANFEDELIHNVTTLLKSNGMWGNTLLIISSDNGGPLDGANNSPLRGGKMSNFQGGVRVVAMISGGYLPENRRNISLDGYIHIADIYSTICSIVGIDPTDKKAETERLPPIDSINMWPYLIGDESVSPRNEIFLSSGNDGGLIQNDYKILFGKQSPAFWTTLDYPNGTKGEPQSINCGSIESGGCLFNIRQDETEHNDIINETQNSALVQQLRARFIQLNKSTFKPDRGKPDANCCKYIHEKNGGYWGPWLD